MIARIAFTLSWLPLAASVLTATAAAEPPKKEKLDRSYSPMAVGDEWIYKASGVYEGEARFLVLGTERVGKTECFVVERTLGDHRLKFYISVGDDGVRIHRVGDDVYDPPFRQFAFPTASGDKWSWKGKIGDESKVYECENDGQHDVTVPAGKYHAFWVRQDRDSLSGNAEFCLARGVGIVKVEGKSNDEHDPPLLAKPRTGQVFLWELKQFKRAQPAAK